MPGALGDVLERAVAAVAEEAVAVGGRVGPGGNGPPWTAVDVEPAVAVVVEQADAAAHRLGELRLRGSWPLSWTNRSPAASASSTNRGTTPAGPAGGSPQARRPLRRSATGLGERPSAVRPPGLGGARRLGRPGLPGALPSRIRAQPRASIRRPRVSARRASSAGSPIDVVPEQEAGSAPWRPSSRPVLRPEPATSAIVAGLRRRGRPAGRGRPCRRAPARPARRGPPRSASASPCREASQARRRSTSAGENVVGRQMVEGLPGPVDVAGRPGQLEPGAPDGNVVGPPSQAGVEPPRRRVELAGANRQVRPRRARRDRRSRRLSRGRPASSRPGTARCRGGRAASARPRGRRCGPRTRRSPVATSSVRPWYR